jgi:hypothetical protein
MMNRLITIGSRRLSTAAAAAAPTTTGFDLSDETYGSVQNYYGKVLGSSKDLKTSACTTMSKPAPSVLAALAKVPQEVRRGARLAQRTACPFSHRRAYFPMHPDYVEVLRLRHADSLLDRGSRHPRPRQRERT